MRRIGRLGMRGRIPVDPKRLFDLSNMKKLSALVLAGFVLASPLAAAAPAEGSAEKLTYAWRLKGGLSWLARLAFPSSGRGTLETNAAGNVRSRLTINADD